MLAAPSSSTAASSSSSSSTYRRRHSHKRSAAISGDFDLDFFKQQVPSISQQLDSPVLSSSVPTTPNSRARDVPKLTITEPEIRPQALKHHEPQEVKCISPTPDHRTHTKVKSWAPTKAQSKKDFKDYNSSSSNETTPEFKRQAVSLLASDYNYAKPSCSSPQYTIPEAIIDLDLASGIYRDPAMPTKLNKKIAHRRTESAPELEDFLKYKVFSKEVSTNSRKNSAIFEEEEDEEDYEALSSTSSSVSNMQINPSMNSLNSNPSLAQQHVAYPKNLQSPSSTFQSVLSTPTSTKTNTTTRRGASATRYQNYYNNNILLSNALKSSESLSQVVAHTPHTASSLHKSSISSFTRQAQTMTPSSSLHSPVPQSPSRFKFESQIYDMPDRPVSATLTSTPIKFKSSPNTNITKSHKKSNSLLKSLGNKIRRNSVSSTISKSDSLQTESFEDTMYLEADSTLTPFDFGEPGPELDLTTMTPKYHNVNHDLPSVSTDESPVIEFSPLKTEKKDKKTRKMFFGWRKK